MRTLLRKTDRQLALGAAILSLLLLYAGNAQGQTYTWSLTDAGPDSWNNSTSWTTTSTGTVPNSTTAIANFLGNNPAASTITLDAAITVNQLNFTVGAAGSGYTIATGNNGTLTFDGTAPQVTISAITPQPANVSEIISANVVLNANTTFFLNTITGGTNQPNTPVGNMNISGAISGVGGITKLGIETLFLSNVNSFTGCIMIGAGTVNLTGSLGGSNNLTFNGTGTFDYDTALSFPQGMGTLTFNAGNGNVISTVGNGEISTTSLNFSSLTTRAPGATANFIVSGGTNGSTNSITIAGLSNTFIDQGTFFNGSNYAWVDAGGFVRGINYTSDTGAYTTGATTTIAATGVAVGGGATLYAQMTGAVSAQQSATFTTLNIYGGYNLTLASGQTLTVNGILKSDPATGSAAIISGGTGIMAANNTELVIRVDQAGDSLTISTPILANGTNGLTFTGAGTLNLGGIANTYTGPTTINYSGGYQTPGFSSVTINSLANGGVASPIGASSADPSNLVINGGVLNVSGISAVTNRGFTVGSAGAIFDIASANVAFTGGANTNGAGNLFFVTGSNPGGPGVSTFTFAGTYASTGSVEVWGYGPNYNTLAVGYYPGGGGNIAGQIGTPTVEGPILLGYSAGAGGAMTINPNGTVYATSVQVGINYYNSLGVLTVNGTLNVAGVLEINQAAGYTSSVTQGAGSSVTAGSVYFSPFGGSAYYYLNGGTLNVATTISGNASSGTNVFSLNGGTLQAGSSSFTVSSGFTFTVGSSGGTIDTNGYTATFNTPITGTGALTEINPGTLILIGSSTSTGALTVSGGTLQLGDGVANIGSYPTIVDNATVVFANPFAQTFAGGLSGTGVLTFAGPGTVTAAGTLSSSFTGSVNVNGGTLELTGANSFAGTLTVNSGGILQLGNGISLGGSLAGTIVDNATVIFADPTLQTFSGSITGTGNVTISGAVVYTGANTYSGVTTLAAGASLFLSGSNASIASSLAFAGSSTFGVIGTSSPTSLTLGSLTVSAGDVTIESMYNGASSSLTLTSASRAAGAAVNFVVSGGVNGSTNAIYFSSQAAGFIDQGTFFNGSNYAWVNSAGGYVRGINYSTDPGAATFAGGTSVSGTYVQVTGAVTAQATAAFTTLNIVGANNFTLAGGATLTVDGILNSASAGTAVISGGTGLTPTNNAELVIRTDGSSTTLSIMTPILANGVNALTKTGTGTLILGSSNTYSGPTTIDNGTLSISSIAYGSSASDSIGTSSNAPSNLVFAGGTLAFTGSSGATDRGFTLAGNSTISVGGGDTLSFSGNVVGIGALTVIGAGSLTLSGNLTTTGNLLTVSGGTTLTLSGTANTFSGGAYLSGGYLDIGNASTNLSGPITIAGGGIANQTGAPLTLAGAETWSGNLTLGVNNNLTLSSPLTLAANTQVTLTSAAPATFTISGAISDGGNGYSLAFAGPSATAVTVALGSSNTFSGGLTVSGGTYSNLLVSGGAIVSIAADTALGVAPAGDTFNNLVLNNGTLSVTATTTLSSNRYIGIGPTSGSTGGTAVFNVASGVVLTLNTTTNGLIGTAGNTGTNNVVFTGGGTTYLYGGTIWNGATNVNSGAVALLSAYSLPIQTDVNIGSAGILFVATTGLGSGSSVNGAGTLLLGRLTGVAGATAAASQIYSTAVQVQVYVNTPAGSTDTMSAGLGVSSYGLIYTQVGAGTEVINGAEPYYTAGGVGTSVGVLDGDLILDYSNVDGNTVASRIHSNAVPTVGAAGALVLGGGELTFRGGSGLNSTEGVGTSVVLDLLAGASTVNNIAVGGGTMTVNFPTITASYAGGTVAVAVHSMRLGGVREV